MSIEDAVNRYMRSEKGKAKLNKCIEKYTVSGEKTASGKTITDKKTVYKLARQLRNSIINTAKMYCDSGDIPQSVFEAIKKLSIGDVVEDKNSYRISLKFEAELHRDSLENGYSDWDGIDNIIALFNNGYSKKSINQTFGYWDNHSRLGSSSFDTRDTGNSIWVPSKTERPGLYFINDGVSDFKSEHTNDKDLKIKVVVNKDYLKNI